MPGDDELIAISGDGAIDRRTGINRIQSSTDQFL
jgi:hypothetical protein